VIEPSSKIQPETRQLNLNDLADAFHLAKDDRVRLMQGILSDLRGIEAVTGRDAADIARRGSLVFHEHLEGRSIRELAAAYIELRLLGAQTGVIDAIETAYGIVGEPPPEDEQQELSRRYAEQVRRMSCPGCGDDEIVG
jgi:hypothetical protein